MAQRVKLLGAAVTVASAGTAVQIASTDIRTSSLIIYAESGNTGDVYVGDSTVSSSLGIAVAKGTSIRISCDNRQEGASDELSLSDIYVDAANSGDKVRVMYLYKR